MSSANPGLITAVVIGALIAVTIVSEADLFGLTRPTADDMLSGNTDDDTLVDERARIVEEEVATGRIAQPPPPPKKQTLLPRPIPQQKDTPAPPPPPPPPPAAEVPAGEGDAVSRFDQRKNWCFEGGTFAKLDVTTYKECAQKCTDKGKACTHFTLNMFIPGQMCRLKYTRNVNSLTNHQNSNDCISGVLKVKHQS
eukprot:m.9114 g.9114  ORF g.9114 m.9114 type:complete len:196 (-) comp2598_c0_seq1:34-621(-)